MTGKHLIDLSVPLTESTQVYPGDPPVRFQPHSTVESDGFNLLSVQMGSQSGTHVDAPLHFLPSGKAIDEVPLDRFIGRAVLIDARRARPRESIGLETVQPVLARLRPGDIALLHTNWSRHWKTAAYFENPFLSLEAAQAILDRGVRTFGIDALNIDETPDATHPGVGFPVHYAIAAVDGIIIENLTNLDALIGKDCTLSALPLAFSGADGAPVRAVAWE